MAESYRLFLALWPDERVRAQLTAYLKLASKTSLHAKPVAAENLHITLRYIGSVDAQQLACIRSVAAKIPMNPFALQLDHQGYWRRPQVAWLGCHHVPEALKQLVHEIESALMGCGIESEPRPYVPHLTLLRKLKYFPVKDIPPIHWSAGSFVLVLSESAPEGVQYSVLNRWP
ncbi:MAG: RNA 2',3'-cyclic phosphodiesterase [Gammaproteobacteria bacterium]|nr:RNA 2',3'-cyclic phosphodiesterase [Gammaproteobacteria bacterium]